MYNGQEAGWADGQLNENNERTDDLDGAAEGENDTTSSRINVVQNQSTAPSRPRSRDSYYDRDRDMRERGEPPEYYGSGRSRNRGNGGGGGGGGGGERSEPRRRRNESYRDADRSRMDEYDYGYRGNRYPAGPMPDRWYPEPYYPPHMGGAYGGGGSRGGYGMPPAGGYHTSAMSVKEMLERLRVEDPRRYRQWYEQYQAHRRNPQRVPNPGLPQFGPVMGPHPPSTPGAPYSGYGGWQGGNGSVYAESTTDRERHSVHSDVGRPSGRSSVNDEIRNLNLSRLDYNNGLPQTPSINQDPDSGFKPIDQHYHESPEPEPKRMTPMKFNTSHCLGVLTPLGHLIKIKNEGSSIEIVQVKSLLCHLPEFKEVSAFPGPLKKDTHKNTVIQFCQKKIKEIRANGEQLDKDNFILLWELLLLLLRKNGNVFGSDVSELLLKKSNMAIADDTSSAEESQSKESSCDEEDSSADVKSEVNHFMPVNEAKASEKFCEFLLYGHKKEALDYAMDNGLWGHALFLATKMDERTYGNVLARFANCTPFNHPLQTFYQLMSGRQPASAKSCCDDTFGDWRPHLAMILSNAGTRPDVEFKSIIKMGDTLGAKGHIFAAQFCYLMAQMDFSPSSKLGPLLGLSSSIDNIIEATQMTEIYEFARSLADSSFRLGPSFHKSTLNYTKTLLDLGFVEEAFAYCEELAKKLKVSTSKGHEEDLESVKWSVLQIAERLVRCEETESEEEPKWIQELRQELVPVKPLADVNLERRDSVGENGVADVHGALIENQNSTAQQHYEQQQPVDYGHVEEPGNVVDSMQPPAVDSSNQNFQQNGPYDIPMYQNSMPSSANPQAPPAIQDQPPHNMEPYSNGPQQYQQPPYGTNLSNQGMAPDNGAQNQPPPYSYQPPVVDSYGGQQYPEAKENHNNNYITPGNGYHPYGQPPPMPDVGPVGAKKKSVRFQDDEQLEDSDDNTLLGHTLKQLALGNDEANDKFAFCHPLRSRVRNNYVGYKENRDLTEHHKFDYQCERPSSAGGERRLSSDEIMEEIQRIASSSHFSSGSHSSFSGSLPTRGTYPIDEPISPLPSISRPSTLGLKKTFPIDKHCCNENQMCEDHDNYYHGSSDSLVSSPTASHPKTQSSNGSLPGAGSNSYVQGKGMDNMQSNYHAMNNNRPPPLQQQHEKSSNDAKTGGPKGSNKGGGGGDANKGSWLGGIFSKFSIKAPNQMILPDDKEPTIVWDPNLKKWVNTKGEEDDSGAPKGPPPTDMDLMRGQPGPPRPPMMQPPMQQTNPLMGPGGGPPMMQQGAQNQPPMMHQRMPPQGNFQQNQNPPVRQEGMQSGPNVPSYPQTQQPQPAVPSNPQEAPNLGGYPTQPNQQINNQPSNAPNPGFNSGVNMNGPPSLPPTGNKYKLPKNRNIRSGYVDILNPHANSAAGGPVGNGGVGGNLMSPAGGAPGVPNMFIPNPIMGSGDSGPVSFLTPAPAGPLPAQSQLETTN